MLAYSSQVALNKRMKFAFVLYLSLSLWGCTWNSKKDKAIEIAKEKMETELLAESASSLEKKPIYHKKYSSVILSKTQFEILKEDAKGNDYVFQVKVKLPPEIIRQSLKEIFAKQNENRETNFNASDALGMIYKEYKMTPDNFHERELTIKISD